MIENICLRIRIILIIILIIESKTDYKKGEIMGQFYEYCIRNSYFWLKTVSRRKEPGLDEKQQKKSNVSTICTIYSVHS